MFGNSVQSNVRECFSKEIKEDRQERDRGRGSQNIECQAKNMWTLCCRKDFIYGFASGERYI